MVRENGIRNHTFGKLQQQMRLSSRLWTPWSQLTLSVPRLLTDGLEVIMALSQRWKDELSDTVHSMTNSCIKDRLT